jgi:putative transposase
MPGTVQGVRKVAAREGWEGQRRLGSKAIEYRFVALPEQTQAALIAASVNAEQTEVAPAFGRCAPLRSRCWC